MGVAAFILAGGKSLRMGRDKAFVLWQGQTLLERALEVAGAVAPRPQIVGAKETFQEYGDVVEDIYSGQGPLGGIHAALRATAADLNLILAVDLPYVTPELLSFLVRRAQDTLVNTSRLAVVPKLASGWEPLCAVYGKEFADAAESALEGGRNAIHSLFEDLEITAIHAEELSSAGFSEQMFRNINTAEDLTRRAGESLAR